MAAPLHKPLGVALLVVLVLACAALLLVDVREFVNTLTRPRNLPVTAAACPGSRNDDGSQPSALLSAPAQAVRVVKAAPDVLKETDGPAVPHVYFPSQVPRDQVPKKHKFAIYRYTHMYGDLPAPLGLRRPTEGTRLEWAKRQRKWGKWHGWDNAIAICASMFQENMQDVREWLLYHQWLGVDHVYLFENGPEDTEGAPRRVRKQLRDFIEQGFVTLEAISHPYYQPFFYHQCAVRHRHKYSWMAFIDLDEFIILRKTDTTLKQFLDGFKTEPGLALNWVLVGPSDQADRPPGGGVLRAYTSCVKAGDKVVKSIANTYYLANVGSNPHVFEYRGDRPTVNEKHAPLGWREALPAACTDGTVTQPALDVNCRRVPAIISEPVSIDAIALFHYLTKSKAEFRAKMARGGGGGTHRKWEQFESIRKHSTKGGLCALPAERAEQCCDPSRFVLPPGPSAQGDAGPPPRTRGPKGHSGRDAGGGGDTVAGDDGKPPPHSSARERRGGGDTDKAAHAGHAAGDVDDDDTTDDDDHGGSDGGGDSVEDESGTAQGQV